MGKSLNIFCDESGDTGFEEGSSKYYIVSLIFHDKRNDISSQIDGFSKNPPFHIGPIIRREEDYKNSSLNERMLFLKRIMVLFSILPITHKDFVYKKKDFNNDEKRILKVLVKDISSFLKGNGEYFSIFNEINIYYDNGQHLVSKALSVSFKALNNNIVIKQNVKQEKYRLAQIADFISSLKLVEMKFANGELSKSEQRMFKNKNDFKRTYLRLLSKKEFK